MNAYDRAWILRNKILYQGDRLLKSVGLAARFVRAGLHVPAQEGARVALVDRILADIGDEQDIRESLSTFSAHLANLAKVVRRAPPRSLVHQWSFKPWVKDVNAASGGPLAIKIIAGPTLGNFRNIYGARKKA